MDASADLQAVAANNSLEITSALRTIAQQYLLYEWFERGSCGITAAAPVGTSNHEGGRAVDLANYDERISAMASGGWSHDVPGDPVHFDPHRVDRRSQPGCESVPGCWNANSQSDQIGVDGEYGPQTEAHLKERRQRPAFRSGRRGLNSDGDGSGSVDSSSGSGDGGGVSSDALVVSVVGPDQVPPQTVAHYTIIVKNAGQRVWPAGTIVQLEGRAGERAVRREAQLLANRGDHALRTTSRPGDHATIDMDVTTPPPR